MTALPRKEPQSGRSAVLSLLKREGPVSADRLAAKLGITAMAVRQHLYALGDDGLVAHEEEARARGRPVKLWRTTEKANASFADAHSALAAELIAQMKQMFGDEGLDRIIAARTAEQEKTYLAELETKRALKARVEALAKIRSREGYMAEVKRDPASGDILLVENHCPICAAARLCTGLCREELRLFESVLGKGVRVERTTHALAGAGRCTYRISEV